jgi:hypothetical protein
LQFTTYTQLNAYFPLLLLSLAVCICQFVPLKPHSRILHHVCLRFT